VLPVSYPDSLSSQPLIVDRLPPSQPGFETPYALCRFSPNYTFGRLVWIASGVLEMDRETRLIV
jgi:hypothetical protein